MNVRLEKSEFPAFYNRLQAWLENSDALHIHLLVSGEDHELSPGPHQYKLLCGVNWNNDACETLSELDNYVEGNFCFGLLPYELKNDIENLESKNEAFYPAMGYLLRKPEVLLKLDHLGNLSVESLGMKDAKEIYEQILSSACTEPSTLLESKLNFDSDITDDQYLNNVERIRDEIVEGNVYELSYCRNYFTKQKINPFALFESFTQNNPTPYSAFIKSDDQYVVCGSMERFLCKLDQVLVSQPIKGTIHNSGHHQEAEKEALLSSEKERAENLMIVDLVRNDLSKSAVVGSVDVRELFGIYSYPNVHQMISTVEAQVPPGIGLEQLIRDSFPMGSMTGAPKLRAMQLIEELESFKRGTYSGSIGYVTEEGNFDWNVVIRSVIYDSSKELVNIPVGSAITYDSVPLEELNECRVKVERIMDLVGGASVH